MDAGEGAGRLDAMDETRPGGSAGLAETAERSPSMHGIGAGPAASAGLAETVERAQPTSGAPATVVRASQTAAEDEPAIAPGSRLGRYIVLRGLGAGAMGVVYEAIDPELDRKVAIKVLHPDAEAGASMSAAPARLAREAQALAKLSHPNVVGIFDVGTHEGRVWIAMELVVGRTLSRWLAERRPDWRQILEVMQAAGRGLAAAHSAGLVHRDVKPDNIMLGDDGRVRVMDFGLARRGAVDAADPQAPRGVEPGPSRISDVTFAGALLGTPAYMAPEQLRGEVAGPQADVFAFCVMFWAALYGQRPFAGETIDELAANVSAGRIAARPRGARSPRWIEAVLLRGLAPTLAQRWPDMDAVLAELARGHSWARMRRWATAAGLLVVTSAAVVGRARYTEAQTVTACEAAGASMAAVWDESARARLQAGLLATGVANAETTAAKVTPLFAAQAEALRAAQTEACLDTRVRGAWDEALLARASWCLDERRMELAALLAELSQADRQSVQRAVPAAAELSEVSPCRDPRRLALLPAPPDAREDVHEVRRALSRATALVAAGKYEAGLAAAEQARALARAIDWPPLVAETGWQVDARSRSRAAMRRRRTRSRPRTSRRRRSGRWRSRRTRPRS